MKDQHFQQAFVFHLSCSVCYYMHGKCTDSEKNRENLISIYYIKKGHKAISGVMELGYYNLGAVRVAYHDEDIINNANGKLNSEKLF